MRAIRWPAHHCGWAYESSLSLRHYSGLHRRKPEPIALRMSAGSGWRRYGKSVDPSMKNTDPVVSLAGSKQLGPSVHQTRAGSSWNTVFIKPVDFMRALPAPPALANGQRPDLIDVELVEEELAGSLLAWTMKSRRQNGLTYAACWSSVAITTKPQEAMCLRSSRIGAAVRSSRFPR